MNVYEVNVLTKFCLKFNELEVSNQMDQFPYIMGEKDGIELK